MKKSDALMRAAELAIATFTVYMVARIVLGPDVIKRANMRMVRGISHTAKRQAEWWQSLAADADTAYHRMTL